jgi:hypothetical protein
MITWDLWKKSFDTWENETAKFLETVVKSPLMLGPSGAMLGVMMKAKTASDKATATLWGSMGLPTKRDQERVLHALNKLESRLLDLEEKLDEQNDAHARSDKSEPRDRKSA